MNLKDRFAALHVRPTNDYAAVEPTGPKERRIENVGAIGGGNENDAFVGFEAVHFYQQLIEGLLALIVPTAKSGSTMASDGVDFVDEDDARRVLLALLEQVTNAACADSYEHLNEIRPGDREERHAGLAGNRAGQKPFAGSRRANEKHAFGDASAQFLEFLRLAEKLDDLLLLLLGLFDAGDALKCHLLLLGRVQAGTALTKAKGFVASALHLAHHEEPKRNEQDKWRNVNQPGDPSGSIAFLHVDDHVLLAKLIIDLRVISRDQRGEGGVLIGKIALDFGSVDGDGLDVSFIDLMHELGEVQRLVFFSGVIVEYRPQQHGEAD